MRIPSCCFKKKLCQGNRRVYLPIYHELWTTIDNKQPHPYLRVKRKRRHCVFVNSVSITIKLSKSKACSMGRGGIENFCGRWLKENWDHSCFRAAFANPHLAGNKAPSHHTHYER